LQSPAAARRIQAKMGGSFAQFVGNNHTLQMGGFGFWASTPTAAASRPSPSGPAGIRLAMFFMAVIG
jgi:hypothetical protein